MAVRDKGCQCYEVRINPEGETGSHSQAPVPGLEQGISEQNQDRSQTVGSSLVTLPKGKFKSRSKDGSR